MQSPALQETCNNLEQTELVFTLPTLAGLPVLWELICIPGTSVRRLQPGTSRHKGAKKTVSSYCTQWEAQETLWIPAVEP